jgi:hypothetical protein
MQIVATCSLCGHPFSSWFNEPELTEHMAEAHDMHFVPGSLRAGDPPRWVSSPHIARQGRP